MHAVFKTWSFINSGIPGLSLFQKTLLNQGFIDMQTYTLLMEEKAGSFQLCLGASTSGPFLAVQKLAPRQY